MKELGAGPPVRTPDQLAVDLAVRLGMGLSLTGVWVGLGASYGRGGGGAHAP